MIGATFLSPTDIMQASELALGAWQKLYPEAGKDFPTHADFDRFALQLEAWMTLVNNQLQAQMRLIASHTHAIPPHTHPFTGPGAVIPVPLTTLTGDPKPQWSGPQWTVPKFLNTSLLPPNIPGSLGFSPRPIVQTPSFVPSHLPLSVLNPGLV